MEWGQASDCNIHFRKDANEISLALVNKLWWSAQNISSCLLGSNANKADVSG